jgi:hypothetical protein
MLNTVKIFRGLRRIVVFPKVVLLEVYPQSVLLSIQQIQQGSLSGGGVINLGAFRSPTDWPASGSDVEDWIFAAFALMFVDPSKSERARRHGVVPPR